MKVKNHKFFTVVVVDFSVKLLFWVSVLMCMDAYFFYANPYGAALIVI